MAQQPSHMSFAPARRADRVRRFAAAGLCVFAANLAPVLAQTNPAPKDAPAGASDNVPRVDLDKLKRPAAPAQPSNLFGARSWEQRAPAKRIAPPPPPPPQAPPLPFTYVGRWIERGDTLVMLSRGGRNYVVHEGDKVDPTYLVEKIDNDKLVIRYLPLDQTQVLLFAGGADTLAQPKPVSPQPPQRRAAPRDADDEED